MGEGALQGLTGPWSDIIEMKMKLSCQVSISNKNPARQWLFRQAKLILFEVATILFIRIKSLFMWDDRSQWENCTPVFGLLAGSVVCLSLIAGPVGIYSVDRMDSVSL